MPLGRAAARRTAASPPTTTTHVRCFDGFDGFDEVTRAAIWAGAAGDHDDSGDEFFQSATIMIVTLLSAACSIIIHEKTSIAR